MKILRHAGNALLDVKKPICCALKLVNCQL